MQTINYLLGYKSLSIVQDTDMFNFSLDSVLLPNFVTIRSKIDKVLDIGCGNAPIPLILSTKTKANIIGVEIQKEVFDLAQKSIAINHLEQQIQIMNVDINQYYHELESDSFDVITCNPPFFKVDEQSKLNDSQYKMIARHELKLNLNQIFKIARKILKNNGNIAIVHRPERLMEILTMMKENNIEPKRIQFVYPKPSMDANILLIEGTKNGKPGLKILPPIFVHNQDGSYTEQVQKYFE